MNFILDKTLCQLVSTEIDSSYINLLRHKEFNVLLHETMFV